MKIAACSLDEVRNPAVVMASMTGSMRLCDHQAEATYPVPGGAGGYVLPGLPPAVGGWAQSEHRGNRLLISGVPTAPAGSLASVLRGVVASDYKHAAGALQSLDGVFAAVFWDALHRRLVVVTDALGVQPLYMLRAGKSLLLADAARAAGLRYTDLLVGAQAGGLAARVADLRPCERGGGRGRPLRDAHRAGVRHGSFSRSAPPRLLLVPVVCGLSCPERGG